MTKAKKITDIAKKIANLPTLPTNVAKMLDLVDNPNAQTAELAKLILSDPSLTARILKIANSEYYGLSGEVANVNTAIVVIGYAAVKEMAFSLTVLDNFKNIGEQKHFDIQKYREHSIKVATTAEVMAKESLAEDCAELFIAGLLHDIGKIILAQYMPKDFSEVMDFSEKNNLPFFEAEQEILGITHAEIGALIAERWNFPEKIVEVIRFHHSPNGAKVNLRKHAEILNAANAVSYEKN